MMVAEQSARRGGPLVMLGLLVAVWIGGRAMLWESPFPALDLANASTLLAQSDDAPSQQAFLQRARAENDADFGEAKTLQQKPDAGIINPFAALARSAAPLRASYGRADNGISPRIAAGHSLLLLAALGRKMPPGDIAGGVEHAIEQPRNLAGVSPIMPVIEQPIPVERWSLDAWAFWRQGSNATLISQGRVPIYGASQIGANLQYRIAPASGHDPRIFARAYRALVGGGETEAALGISTRPLGFVPARVAAELRVTDNEFGTEARPAVIVVTEIPPIGLPADFALEAYGGAGYVGGDDATLFADGQATITREFASFSGSAANRARVSVGAGAWGGAQEGAERVDLGPTVRLDLTLGQVPARVSLDWRERVSGDAAPDSGVAATLSTRF